MIAEIRDYIADSIAIDSPDRLEIIDEFGNDDLANVFNAKSYKAIIGEIVCERSGNEYSSQVPVTVEIFNDRSMDDRTSFDVLMEEALCLRKTFQNPVTMPFTDLDITSIEPFNIVTNDKFVGMRLQLIIREDYTY